MAAPIFAFTGRSGVGKTTLLCGVIEALSERGLRVGVVKHSGKGFADPDPPGKDSRRMREAGAAALALGCADRTVVFRDHPSGELSFSDRVAALGPVDLVLVESYRSESLPTAEVLRRGHSEELEFAGEVRLELVVADLEQDTGVPTLPLSEPGSVADWLIDRFGLA